MIKQLIYDLIIAQSCYIVNFWNSHKSTSESQITTGSPSYSNNKNLDITHSWGSAGPNCIIRRLCHNNKNSTDLQFPLRLPHDLPHHRYSKSSMTNYFSRFSKFNRQVKKLQKIKCLQLNIPTEPFSNRHSLQ